MTRERVVTSTLPPDTTHTVFFPVSTFPNMHAATGVAPAPSATVFWFSMRESMAAHISSSLTVTISSTYCWHSSKVSLPGVRTRMPSAMVSRSGTVMIFPMRTDSYMEPTAAACTPTTWQEGFRLFTAKAMPEMSPPPPIGQTICSTSCSCSNISRPMVPWPAMT